MKSEREKQIPYANTYIRNLKTKTKKVLKNLGAGQQGRNKDADVENGLGDTELWGKVSWD